MSEKLLRFSTPHRCEQGGRTNYDNGTVSLRAVPMSDQNRQSGILSAFYAYGQVSSSGALDPGR